MLWLHPNLVDAVLPAGHTFVTDPQINPIAQMRRVYDPKMYVLLFQDGKAADVAMDRDKRATLRNAMRKDLGTSAGWNKLPPAVVNMEYYGQPVPARLPGRDVQTPQQMDVYTHAFERTASRLASTGTAICRVTGALASTSIRISACRRS